MKRNEWLELFRIVSCLADGIIKIVIVFSFIRFLVHIAPMTMVYLQNIAESLEVIAAAMK